MSKWFEEIDSKNSNVIYSRVRLARNWDEYVFPSRMTAASAARWWNASGRDLRGLRTGWPGFKLQPAGPDTGAGEDGPQGAQNP